MARPNFTTGEHSNHGKRYQDLRRAAEATGHSIAVLADLQGPKIKLGRLGRRRGEWRTGDWIRITVDAIDGDHDRVSTTYKQLAHDVKPGNRLLVDDGNLGPGRSREDARVDDGRGVVVAADSTEAQSIR